VTEEDGRGKAFQIEGTAYVEPVDRVLIARITRGSVSGNQENNSSRPVCANSS
jgi:hypothetical protein